MAKPQDFTITIEPDGRIILDVGGLRETSYLRILEYLEETVGPARLVEVSPGDPPQRHLHAQARETEEAQLKVDRGSGG